MLSAEMGSNILEFTRLSQVTGNKSYFDIGQRTTDWLQRYVLDKTQYPPLLPVSFNSDMHEATPLAGTYTMGGMGMSC
jgi:mannosyl-oligosaccharide alpha-1,2-mannosidase